jgi:hypothetical protein
MQIIEETLCANRKEKKKKMLQAINKIPLQSVFILKSSSVERACG